MKRLLNGSPLVQGLITAAVVGLVLLAGQRSLVASAPARVDTHTPLLLSSRTDLNVCVQAVDPEAARQETIAKVKAGIASLSNHRLWSAYDHFKQNVEYGCPGTPYLTSYSNAKSYPAIPRVTSPSPYRLFVYVMPEEWIQANLPSDEKRVWGQEAVCEDHNCAAVSEGVYISLNELRNPTDLRDILAKGLGLEPSYRMVPDNNKGER